jgi:hypothetical protein
MTDYSLRYQNQILKLLLSFTILTGLYSCEKEAGIGGTGEIKGMVTVRLFDPEFKVLQASYPATGKTVYILYGDETTISDNTKTSYSGEFNFQYLREGNYKIFAYSESSLESSPSESITVEKEVTLSSNKDAIDIGELVIYKSIDVTDGDATITGRVRQVNYTKDFNFIKDTINAQEKTVYVLYEDYPEYIDRLRTLDDGTFAISNLIKGKYTIMVLSEDTNGGKEDIGVTKNPEITNFGQTVDVGDIFVAKN